MFNNYPNSNFCLLWLERPLAFATDTNIWECALGEVTFRKSKICSPDKNSKLAKIAEKTGKIVKFAARTNFELQYFYDSEKK